MLDPAFVDDGIVRELVAFVREEKQWVLGPMVVALGSLSALLVAAEGSAISPFIYSIF